MELAELGNDETTGGCGLPNQDAEAAMYMSMNCIATRCVPMRYMATTYIPLNSMSHETQVRAQMTPIPSPADELSQSCPLMTPI